MYKKILLWIFLFGGFCIQSFGQIQNIDSLRKSFSAELNNRFVYKDSDPSKPIDPKIDQELLDSRLKKIDQKSVLSLRYNSTVHQYVERNLRMGEHYGKVLGLAEFYFPLFEEIFAKYGVPKELRYLAVVESNLNPVAGSKAGARGLWQFMYATGSMYGLKSTSYVEDRYDPIKSTEAAAKYLKSLYNQSGEWDLALASYNCGYGNVLKAQRSSGKKSYWDIRPWLPKETQGYVPGFIAANYLFEYQAQHNIPVYHPKYKYSQTGIHYVKNQVSFTQLSRGLGISVDDLTFLNPQYRVGIIPGGGIYYVRLPLEALKKFKANEKSIYQAAASTPKPASSTPGAPEVAKGFHRVAAGETLYSIAQKYGLTIEEIKTLNKLSTGNLLLNQVLRVEKPATQPQEILDKEEQKRKMKEEFYRQLEENS
ncbi:MAG: lytic transglycosylase [Flavobacteriaceae bacterium]|nr:MAG: lytic transglycosylase [Flavobacteriaceae bacterium]